MKDPIVATIIEQPLETPPYASITEVAIQLKRAGLQIRDRFDHDPALKGLYVSSANFTERKDGGLSIRLVCTEKPKDEREGT